MTAPSATPAASTMVTWQRSRLPGASLGSWPPSTPVRGTAPLRGLARPGSVDQGRHGWETWHTRVAIGEARGLRRGPTLQPRHEGRSDPPSTVEDEGAIQEFYGQLWFIPRDPPNLGIRVQKREEVFENLVWVRKDLWESKSFEGRPIATR